MYISSLSRGSRSSLRLSSPNNLKKPNNSPSTNHQPRFKHSSCNSTNSPDNTDKLECSPRMASPGYGSSSNRVYKQSKRDSSNNPNNPSSANSPSSPTNSNKTPPGSRVYKHSHHPSNLSIQLYTQILNMTSLSPNEISANNVRLGLSILYLYTYTPDSPDAPDNPLIAL